MTNTTRTTTRTVHRNTNRKTAARTTDGNRNSIRCHATPDIHATFVSRLAALANPKRLRVFRLLVQAGAGGINAGTLAQATGTSASALSFHLKDLQDAALIRGTQQGRFVVYTAQFDAMQALIDYLTENCCEGSSCELSGFDTDACTGADESLAP